MAKPSDPFLKSLVATLDDENTIGITLGGSHARGEGGRYSDVDLRRYVRTEPTADPNSLSFVGDILVSVYSLTIDDEVKRLHQPNRAIWTIPGLRQARILLDKDGSIARMIEAARQVDWHDLQPSADQYASNELCSLAEEVYKVLAGLAKGDESKTVYALWGLSEGLSTILLVQRGVLIPTENAYLDLAQATAGRDSNWSRQLRLVLGMDVLPTDEPPYCSIGQAGIRLYQETVAIMQDLILPDDAVVIKRTLKSIVEAGFQWT